MKALRALSITALVVAGVSLAFSLHLVGEDEDEFIYEDFANAMVDTGCFGDSGSFNDELMEERIIVVSGSVNARFSRDLVSKLLILAKRSSTEPIDIYLRTEGGWEADVFAVIDVMQSIGPKVNIYATGEAHSAGVILLVAATGERYVYPDTILGFHCLNSDEEQIFEDRYVSFFQKHADLPEDWLERNGGELHYFTAEEALKYNVADKILKTSED